MGPSAGFFTTSVKDGIAVVAKEEKVRRNKSVY